jgi:hypothetical protein
MGTAAKQAVEEEHLAQLVEGLRAAAGSNLVNVTLYGSAVSPDFHNDFSDINLLCVAGDLSAASLDALAPAVSRWTSGGNPAPLFFAKSELERAAAVFPIEMLDIQQQHHTIHGEDVFKDLKVPLDRHKAQLQQELRTKLLLLRQHYLACSNLAGRVRLLMLDSVSNFIVLFRHVLLATGDEPARAKREIVTQLAQKARFNPDVFLELLQVREHKAQADSIDSGPAFSRYLQAIEQAIRALDAA